MNAIFDLRYAWRLLVRSPVFTITAVLSLAAGIAGTAAVFSLADALLLRPRAGVAHPETLVDIARGDHGEGMDNFGYPLFEVMRARTTLLEGVAAHRLEPDVMSLGDARSSERVYGMLVSGNYFSVVGTRLAFGRFFLPDEDATAGTHPVVVLSYDFWTRRFGRRTEIVGQSLRLNNRPYTVIGVAEEGFTGTAFTTADFWVPMAMDAHVRASATSLRENHGAVWMIALGRMKTGVTPRQVRDELQAVMHSYLTERGSDRVNRWTAAVERSARIPGAFSGPVMGFIGMLAVLTGLVLVIACSNVAGMLIARGIDRRREIATRLALGASRARLLGQLLLEGLMLAVIAGAISILLTWILVNVMSAFRPSIPLPLALDPRVDPRVMFVAFVVAILSSIAFALLPALQSTRLDVSPALRGTNASADRRRVRLRQVLVCGQVGIALLLLVAAGLFLRSLTRAAGMDIGFNVKDVDILQIDTRIGGYSGEAESLRVVESVRERFRHLQGVSSVAASRVVQLMGSRMGLGALRAPGYVGQDGTDGVGADWDIVTADYFETLQVGIVQGRSFTTHDRAGAPTVAIVNQTMASRLWPGQNPIGRRLIHGSDAATARTLEVVGVARDGKYAHLTDGPRNFIYVPLAQQFASELTFYVRRQPGPSRIGDLRRSVADVDPMLPVIHADTLEQATSIALLPQRVAAWIAASVGSLGLFLAALGLYGLTAFSVSQRRREIAIRLAVGAPQGSVVWLVLRQAAVLAVVGGSVGLVLAVVLSTLLQSFLVGLNPIDLPAFAVAFAMLAGVMFLSSWLPAARAARMDPVQSLRAE
jgi:predicted permease